MGSLFSYFNLNKAPDNKYFSLHERSMPVSNLNVLEDALPIDEIDNSETETRGTISIGQQLLMYFGVFIGVFFSSLVLEMKEGKNPIKFDINWITVIISLVISLILIPKVYEKLEVNPKSPFIVKLGLFVQQGVFWQVLLGAIGKTI